MTTAYEELEQAWKREFHASELQPLRQGFYKDLASYAKRLREAQRNLDTKSLKAIILEEEMQRLAHLSIQLVDRRLEKLWANPSPVQADNLEPVERQVHQDISGIQRNVQKLKDDLEQGREPLHSKPPGSGLVLIRFVRDVPSIIGVDLKTHGPFLREDVAKLPHENAESLIRQGAAVEIRTTAQDNE